MQQQGEPEAHDFVKPSRHLAKQNGLARDENDCVRVRPAWLRLFFEQHYTRSDGLDLE
jgi:hypothetical protein